MSNKQTKDFEFKQFKITGGNSGMPVSTDGVMLGAWADVSTAKSILDIGTGTGLLALMCAQRNPTASIVAVDIDNSAAKAAIRNVELSPWQSRVTVNELDVLKHNFSHTFEHIICNPPYFNSGQVAKNQSRAAARHSHLLPHKELVIRCFDLLDVDGKASFILPTEEAEHMLAYATQIGWFVHRKLEIRTTQNKPISRILFELVKIPCHLESQQMTIQTPGLDNKLSYSAEFKLLTQAFYLKM